MAAVGEGQAPAAQGPQAAAAPAEWQAAHTAMVAAEAELLDGRMSDETYGPIWSRAMVAQRQLQDMGLWPVA